MKIIPLTAEFSRIADVNQEIEELGRGYGGSIGPAEGPVWIKDGSYLVCSVIHNNRRMRWTYSDGVTIFQEPTGYANGLTLDLKGRILACEHGPRRVTRQDKDGEITVVAGSFRGTRLNRPNDIVVKSDGCHYFTDPGAPAPELDMEYSGVYMVSPDLGTITLLVRDFVTPNGLAFSPDESILYINDTRRQHIRAFDVLPNGTLALASDRLFCDLKGDEPGVPDGMKVDSEGNLYCGGSGGIWVINSEGNHVGTISHGESTTTNVAFGGDDLKTLFFTTWNTLGRVQLNIPGSPLPTGRDAD